MDDEIKRSTARSAKESLINCHSSASLASISEAFQPAANLLKSGKSIDQSFPKMESSMLWAKLSFRAVYVHINETTSVMLSAPLDH